MAIIAAARGRCDLLWLVDASDPDVGSMTKLLARTGTVIDISGMSPGQAASATATHRPDGVLALADDLLVWTAHVAAELELPFLGVDAAVRLTDKFAQRDAFRAAGLAAPGSTVVNSRTSSVEWERIAAECHFPAVLKPRRGEGSRNTLAATSAAHAREVVETAARDDDALGDWVLEEYIPDIDRPVCGEGFANYVSVESFISHGTLQHLAVTGRTPPAQPFRETGFFIPAAVETTLAATIRETAERSILALGATIGCFHTEVKLTPTGPVVIEVNGRIGGGVPEMLALITNVDFLGIAIRIALGENVVMDVPDPAGVGYLLYVQPPNRISRVTSVSGLTELQSLSDVHEIALNRGPGHSVDWRDGNHGHVFSVLGSTESHDSFRSLFHQVESVVSIDGV
ncbi:ATP-grasp domain-containing protein [Flexivirga caeni]|nr:ATP-grasp domain-containing protein [Flexivirga caeni]